MNKLLEAFKANQSEANRTRLFKYMVKHPMAICMIGPDDQAFLKRHWLLV
jgi:hypothetical protein